MFLEDTREVGPVAPVDLRAERANTLRLSVPILHLGGFPDLYIHSFRGDSRWDNQACKRTAGSGTCSATGSIWRVQERLLGTKTRVHADMSLLDYCSIMYRNRPREAQRGNGQTHNMDFIKKVGKLNIPTFDGSSRCSAQAWVQKLDTYFKLNPMTELEAINFATLHFDGEAHEWWYHGLVTLGHNQITSYLEFTEMLMERFDRRDPKLHFRDLTQLRQTGSVEAFIVEFQQKAVVVFDISEHRLVMLFTEALTEPLRGWVKAFKPHTLQEAIVRMRDMGI